MKRIILIIMGLSFAGLAVAVYLYFKPKSTLHHSRPDFTMTAAKLAEAFEQNEPESNEKYLDKIISVNGVIETLDVGRSGTASLLLQTGNPVMMINCELDKSESIKAKSLTAGQSVKIKGRCAGLLTDVVLTGCIIEE